MFQQGIVISSTVALLGLIVLIYLGYKIIHDKMSFLSTYPSDLINDYNSKVTKTILYWLYLILSGFNFVFFFFTFNTKTTLIGGCILLFASLLAIILPFFKNIKSLSYYSIIYFLISSFGSLMCGLGGIVEVQIAGHYSYPLWLAIIFIIIGVIEFGLVFVPPLWNIQFNQKTEENGKTIYIRPKKSILSLFQWIYLGIGYIQCILLLIASFLLKL